MATLKKEVENEFTVVHNDFLRDENLGLAERGILVTMLSLPESEEITAASLAEQVPDSEETVTKALRMLEMYGYLSKTDSEYIISDEAIFGEEGV